MSFEGTNYSIVTLTYLLKKYLVDMADFKFNKHLSMSLVQLILFNSMFTSVHFYKAVPKQIIQINLSEPK